MTTVRPKRARPAGPPIVNGEWRAWRLVVSGRRYVVLAGSVDEARTRASERFPGVDFSRCIPVVHADDNL
jgi:hypothetical protein